PPPAPQQPQRPPPGIQPASDDLWDKAGAKGCTLGWGMHASDLDAGALFVPIRVSAKSDYETTKDLGLWFWYPFPQDRLAESFFDLYETWGIGWALKELGVSDYTSEYEGGKHQLVSIAHQNYESSVDIVDRQWYDVEDDWYRATGASYSFLCNPDEGMIVALSRESPKWAAKERSPPVPDNLLPKLSSFSDVAWITWKAMHKPPWSSETRLNHLKYFLSVSIVNKETQQILTRAHEANHWDLEDWPGHIFERIWPETKAILGSPNVQGFAYFLIQHKAELGSMFIDKIQVFRGETKAELPCILMHVRQPLGQSVAVKREITQEDKENGTVRTHIFRAIL
ncbi:hypothetical protein IQ06DRAFT_219646, partial [Phaeosphaeriaceae sp. SRC1lsM3a]